MTQPKVDEATLAAFKTVVEHRLGWALREDDDRRSADLLADLAARRGIGPRSLVDALADPRELGPLADALTINETYFFRNDDHFEALRGQILPDLLRTARAEGRPLRVLSAGCSSGEEPYSLVIALEEIGAETSEFEVVAVDVSPAVLERARRARYSAWALRATPDETRARYFTRHGQTWALSPSIVERVTFAWANLSTRDAIPSDPFDLILCRNVLMYFSADAMGAALERLEHALRPGGYLMLGHAENIRPHASRLALRSSHDTFYYQRTPVPAPTDTRNDTAWYDAIGRGGERIAALHQRLAAAGSTGSTPPPGQASPTMGSPASPDLRRAATSNEPAPSTLERIAELIAAERLPEALAELERLPTIERRGTRGILLAAVLALHTNRLSEVANLCGGLIKADVGEASQADAHHLLALRLEHLGDLEGAIAHDQIAASLDAGFAMARMHLGLMLAKSGDQDAARRALRDATSLMDTERAERLAWFGGGFSRDALAAHCERMTRAPEDRHE